MKKFDSVLIISDQHYPYNHPDIIAFLKALHKKYKFDRIVNVGDEADFHDASFHDSDKDLPSAGDELKQTVAGLSSLYKLFPVMDLVESNHGSMMYRRAKAHGIPRHVIRPYREVLQAPKTWKWHNELILRTSLNEDVAIFHGKSANILQVAQGYGMHCVSGHFHEKFKIEYCAGPNGYRWGMIVGCLIDDASLAFNYNKVNPKRPVIGCGGIIHGVPRLFPMQLNRHGRWTGVTP